MSRIAILTPYAKPVVGGISTFVAGMTRVITARGHEVFVVAGHGNGDSNDHSDVGLGREFFRSSLKALHAIRPDIVHAQAHWYVLASAVRYARIHPGTRTIFSFHTTPNLPLGRRFLRLLRQADVVTFVSAEQKRQLSPSLELSNESFVLLPAVDIPNIPVNLTRQWVVANDLDDARPLVAFCGPLEYLGKVDGVIALVRGLPKVRLEYPSARLVVIGDGFFRERLEKAAVECRENVLITGFVGNPLVPMAAADIYCHVSFQDSFGIAVLEAMALGLPVIVSRDGATADLFDGQNILAVDPVPHAIAAAICWLMREDSIRERMGAAAKEAILRSFTWDVRWPEISRAYAIS